VGDFIQGPDSRVVCNPRTEIEDGESSRRVEEKPEPKVPDEGKVAQRRGHSGGKREWCAAERREQKGSRL
jgi:hypothetical protein